MVEILIPKITPIMPRKTQLCPRCGGAFVRAPKEDQHYYMQQWRCRDCNYGVIVCKTEPARLSFKGGKAGK